MTAVGEAIGVREGDIVGGDVPVEVTIIVGIGVTVRCGNVISSVGATPVCSGCTPCERISLLSPPCIE
jgi:hypothetical protein